MNKKLNFIIIGAAKAATTSLAVYLRESPHIYIPPEKEVPYFFDKRMQKKGWKWCCDTYFRNADDGQLWGTSTPQYMMHPECFQTIKKALPDVKIIASLRDPVARLVSHFALMKRLGFEKRSLNQVIEEQLSRSEYYRSVSADHYTGKYLVSGEYGRILSELFRYFERSHVLVLDFEDIQKDAKQVVNHISNFLGIDNFAPKNINRIRLQGGSQKKFNIDHYKLFSMLENFLRGIGIGGLLSDRAKAKVGGFSSWLDEVNVIPTSKMGISDIRPNLLHRLHEHYLVDTMKLNALEIEASWIKNIWSKEER